MNKSLKINSPSSEYVVYERILGRGAYGVVLLAKQVKTLKNYAMKIINKVQLQKANGLQNVRQEILLQTKIQHANIVSLIESFEDDQYIYLVLEYCAKGNLLTYINQNGPLTECVAYKYFIQIASGINHIHQQGIIHRDIKLDNLLLNDLGQVKICDFNWATQMQNGRADPIICGTLQYMPPEVHFNNYQNSKLDIWSLGVVLYELMHCKLPFEYNNSEITLMENISPECQQLVRQMLSLNHQERPNIKQVLSSQWIKNKQSDLSEYSFTPRYHHHQPQHSLYLQQIRLVTEY